MNYAGLNEPLGQRNVLAYWPPRSKQSQDSANKKVFFSNFIFNSFKFDAHQNFDIFKANFIYTFAKVFSTAKGQWQILQTLYVCKLRCWCHTGSEITFSMTLFTIVGHLSDRPLVISMHSIVGTSNTSKSCDTRSGYPHDLFMGSRKIKWLSWKTMPTKSSQNWWTCHRQKKF